MVNQTQIPSARVPLTEGENNLISREWFRYFNNINTLAGGGTGLIPVSSGGTGTSTIPPSGSVLIGNGTNYTVGTVIAGPGINVNSSSAAITVSLAGGVIPPGQDGQDSEEVNFFGIGPAQPAGSNTQIQFNNGGAFGAISTFAYDTATSTFTVGPAGTTTTIETLAPTGSTVAGTLRFRGKNASATNGAGGGFSFLGGTGTGTNAGGGFSVSGGSGGATGGGFGFIGGGGTALGGGIQFDCGSGTGASGLGGSFNMNSGQGQLDGGAFNMAGGFCINGTGGGFVLQSGFSINGNGGDFSFVALGGPLGNGQMYFDTDFGGTVIQLTSTTGGDPQLGFYGTVPVAQQASAPVATNLATAITLVNALRTALLNLGLIV